MCIRDRRAGAVHDATDRAQIQELIINSEMAERAHKQGVQVIVEGPGHVPLDQIATNVKLMKEMSGHKPFYMHCLLYTSDAADERSSEDLGGRRIIKKNNDLSPIHI